MLVILVIFSKVLRGQRLQIMLYKSKPINLFWTASEKGKGKRRFGKGTLYSI